MIAGRDKVGAPLGRPGVSGAGGLRGGRGVRGESLTEVLVAIVVGGLALLLLAMAISTSANMNRTAREAMDSYYRANNALAGAAAADSFIASVTISEEGSAGAEGGSADSAWSQTYSVDCVTEGAVASYELSAGSGSGAGSGGSRGDVAQEATP